MQRIISKFLTSRKSASARKTEEELNFASMALRARVEEIIRQGDQKRAA